MVRKIARAGSMNRVTVKRSVDAAGYHARDYGTFVRPIRRIGFAWSRTIFSLSFRELNRERRCNAAILRRHESRERGSFSWKVSMLFLRFPQPPTFSSPVTLFFVSTPSICPCPWLVPLSRNERACARNHPSKESAR